MKSGGIGMSGNLSGIELAKLVMILEQLKTENQRLKKENEVFFLQSSTWIDKSITASVENKQIKETLMKYAELVSMLVHALQDATDIAECRGYTVESARRLIKKAKEMTV